MEKRQVYLDNNATTPIHPEVKDALINSFDLYGNASSMHGFGRKSRVLVEKARDAAASLLGADPSEIIFTGGGSESNNTVLKSVGCKAHGCEGCAISKSEIIISEIEHPSVLETVKELETTGIKVKYLKVDKTGKVNLDRLNDIISDQTALVSVMMANNEIGTIQDIKAITNIAHKSGALVHTDAVQAVGKIPVNVNDLDVDFLSFSGHKIYGPKGVGGLYARRGVHYCTFINGGHQEDGRRAGTLNTTGIIGMGKALEIVQRDLGMEMKKLGALKQRLKEGIIRLVPDIVVNGHSEDVLPGTLNISFLNVEGESILLYLDLDGIAVSTGSACATGSLEPSHVILATGQSPELAHGSIRFSIGSMNTEEDIDYVLDKVPAVIERLRKISTIKTGGKR